MKKSSLIADKSAAELDAIAARFERENAIDEFRPLTDAEWADFEQWRARLRKRKSKPGQRVLLTLDKKLVARANAAAKRLHVERDDLVARGIERLLEGLERGK